MKVVDGDSDSSTIDMKSNVKCFVTLALVIVDQEHKLSTYCSLDDAG